MAATSAAATASNNNKNKKNQSATSAAISTSSTMPLDIPLSSTANVRKCRLVRRYKRFLADVVFPEDEGDDGSAEPANFVTVHCPNTGPMTGLLDSCPRAEAWVSVADDPLNKRKYKHTLEAIRPSPAEAVVGVHSAAANKVVRALLEAGVLSEKGKEGGKEGKGEEGGGGEEEEGEGFALLPRLADGEGSICAEFSFGKKNNNRKNASDSGALSRADFLLKCGDERGGDLLLEVKSVTLAEERDSSSSSSSSSKNNRLALFPDTVSLRAQRHCRDLEEAVTSSSSSTANRRAAIVFLIQRGDCDRFSPSEECDADYARALRSAAAAGVSVLAVRGEVVVPNEGGEEGEDEGKKGIMFRYLGRARVDLGSDAEGEEEAEKVEKQKGSRANKRKK